MRGSLIQAVLRCGGAVVGQVRRDTPCWGAAAARGGDARPPAGVWRRIDAEAWRCCRPRSSGIGGYAADGGLRDVLPRGAVPPRRHRGGGQVGVERGGGGRCQPLCRPVPGRKMNSIGLSPVSPPVDAVAICNLLHAGFRAGASSRFVEDRCAPSSRRKFRRGARHQPEWDQSGAGRRQAGRARRAVPVRHGLRRRPRHGRARGRAGPAQAVLAGKAGRCRRGASIRRDATPRKTGSAHAAGTPGAARPRGRRSRCEDPDDGLGEVRRRDNAVEVPVPRAPEPAGVGRSRVVVAARPGRHGGGGGGGDRPAGHLRPGLGEQGEQPAMHGRVGVRSGFARRLCHRQ